MKKREAEGRRSLKTWKIMNKPVPERYQHLRTFASALVPSSQPERHVLWC
jgi:hypothetical protein